MSSADRDKWIRESEEEIKELLKKRVDYGWSQKDADRYAYLVSKL